MDYTAPELLGDLTVQGREYLGTLEELQRAITKGKHWAIHHIVHHMLVKEGLELT
jgi:hypothetical protein